LLKNFNLEEPAALATTVQLLQRPDEIRLFQAFSGKADGSKIP
jgi:hypothetical protein